ncbi:MAG: ribonuclease Z [Pseudanabaenaceae cyanobacterium bins.39]|nr:ribonuclease Z [Pseudanabaenaceae cyanobacterium bins.39]
MQITFLGTSSGVPTRGRNVSSVAVRLPQRAEVWLLDCGEATQHQLLKSDVKISQITKIFITHLHGDHIFGLPGLLASCGMAGNVSHIDIYGPSGLGEYLDACLRYSETRLSYSIKVHRVRTGMVCEDADFYMMAAPLKHKVTAYGYRLVERDRSGKFDVQRAIAEGIPPGPLFGELKRGKVITLDDGRVFDGTQFCGEPLIGRKIAYCTDTIFCDSAVELAQEANVLIHEATFAHQDSDMAFQRLHSTSTMAAQVALLANVKQLIMTHFSPRYAPGNSVLLEDLVKEARMIFANTIPAHDFLTYEVVHS